MAEFGTLWRELGAAHNPLAIKPLSDWPDEMEQVVPGLSVVVWVRAIEPCLCMLEGELCGNFVWRLSCPSIRSHSISCPAQIDRFT